MEKLYSLTVRLITILIALIAFNQGVVMSMQQRVILDTTKVKPLKIADTHTNRLISYTSATKSDYIPFRPATVSGITLKEIQPGPVPGLNVKIYPVPVTDQINLSYHLSKDSNVIIEILNVLGNKISTLFSKRVSAGEQNNSFPINSRFSNGIYLIKITADNQQVVKRISVL